METVYSAPGNDGKKKFKSYYVVWKLFFVSINKKERERLNRTM